MVTPGTVEHYQYGSYSAMDIMKWDKVVPEALLGNGGQNFIVFRLAEVMLMYAEASIEAGLLTDEMYDAIDAVRVRAGMPVVDRVGL
ncbi:MAG: RagB/SusD family nutrient uptake outer membrane protein [Flavitalea sp.]